MGATPWLYRVPYQDDVNTALQELREKEFRAGRYRGIGKNYIRASGFQYKDWSGNTEEEIEQLISQLGSIEAAISHVVELTGENGTASILDMFQVSDIPDYYTVSPVSTDAFLEFFKTDNPTYNTLITSEAFWDSLERGQGVYVILFEDNQPLEICFAGYSFD